VQIVESFCVVDANYVGHLARSSCALPDLVARIVRWTQESDSVGEHRILVNFDHCACELCFIKTEGIGFSFRLEVKENPTSVISSFAALIWSLLGPEWRLCLDGGLPYTAHEWANTMYERALQEYYQRPGAETSEFENKVKP
jgi:hypothetical protein